MKKIKVKELEELMASPTLKFRTLPANIALWLLYRRTIDRPISAWVIADMDIGITIPMIENFFSNKYGIGQLDKKTFSAIFELFGQKRLSDSEIEKMIEDCEAQYGKKADQMMKKGREKKK